jgi:hypothetical protein
MKILYDSYKITAQFIHSKGGLNVVYVFIE